MRTNHYEVRDGGLVRRVVPGRGRPYVHRCTREAFTALAAHLDGRSAPITIDALHQELALPHTQVAVAIAFLKERGCLVVERRRSYPASRFFFEDAMCEYHALEHLGASS